MIIKDNITIIKEYKVIKNKDNNKVNDNDVNESVEYRILYE